MLVVDAALAVELALDRLGEQADSAFGGDADAWEEDLARATPAGREAAEAARRDYGRDGIPIAQLRRIAEHGHDRTVLPACMKVYLPPPNGRFGMVFMLKFQPDGRPVLMFLAFDMRHHPHGSRRSTVYQVAHQRLHGRPSRH